MIAVAPSRIAPTPCAAGVGRVTVRRAIAPAPRPRRAPQALPDPQLFADIAAAGDVDAPLPVVAGLAIVISAAALAFFSFGLKPGSSYSPSYRLPSHLKPL